MHAKRALAQALLLMLAASSAQAGPIRCADDGDGGGACVWGRAEAFDADTIQLRGLRIQVLGVAAPGPRDLCATRDGKSEFACARPARKRMAELVAKGVACDILDVSGGILFGRCRGAEGDVGRLLVAAGVARAAKDGPYEAEQAAALAAGRGLWADSLSSPKEWESARRKAARD